MPKQYKIIVCVATNDKERTEMVQRMVVNKGLASTPSDARKIIRQSPVDFDLYETYFVAASTFSLTSSNLTTHRLYQMAVSGILVIVGAKRIPPVYELMCEAYYQGDI